MSPLTPKPVDRTGHFLDSHVQASAGGHRIVSTYWQGLVGWSTCACGRVTEVYDGGFLECRVARLEEELAAKLDALRAELSRRLATAESACLGDAREWERVQRRRRRTA